MTAPNENGPRLHPRPAETGHSRASPLTRASLPRREAISKEDET